jgi:2-dehydropantoate 2-reductase
MRFIMCGAGAIGGIIGGYLALHGQSVLFIDKNGEHVDCINKKGLLLKGIRGTYTIPAQAVYQPSEITFQENDVCFLAVKSYHTLEAVQELRKVAPATLPIFCAQNGVRNEEVAHPYFPGQTHGVMIYFGATCTQPGVVVHTSGEKLGLGLYPQGASVTAAQVGEQLNRTPLRAFVTESIMELKWNKLILNLNNATYGLVGLSVQEAQNSPEMRHLLADVMEEGLQVIREAGISYTSIPGDPTPEMIIQKLREEHFQGPEIPKEKEMLHQASLWQDLFLQRGVVETDSFNGEIVRLGQRIGKNTPLNTRLLTLCNAMAERKEKPGKYGVAELRKLLEQEG